MRNTPSWSPFHRRYERFCALASAGQLGGPEMFELNVHVGACRFCREFLASVNQMTVQALPLLAESKMEGLESDPPAEMRARFLDRLALEQVNRPTSTEVLDFERASPHMIKERQRTSLVESASKRGWFSGRAAAAVSAALLLGVAGFYAGKRVRYFDNGANKADAIAASIPTAQSDNSVRIEDLEKQKGALQGQLVLLKRQLTTSANERDSLARQLADAVEKVSAQKPAAETADRVTENQEVRVEVSLLQSEVDRLRLKLRDSDEKLAAERQTTVEVSEKLQLAEADLGRERDLKLAKNEMGEVVGSRNLHIVDVYDADANGKPQPAFGRVFYVEDKSLVFYAYDLDRPGQFKANVVFHVWGGKAGIKEVTHNLGIMRRDDPGQNRWAMTFDDPKVLAEINSVFVTAEVPNKSYDSPHGRKVLYAYFGGPPNHP